MNRRKRRFSQRFGDAFRGILYAIKSERNMRIHTVAALYVFVFSFFFEMSPTRYAVLFLTFAAVMAAELFNTSIERLSDELTDEYNPRIGAVKDLSAGGVLVCAFFAVAVGIALFWQPDAFRHLWCWFCARPWMFAVLAVITAAALWYIARGPAGIRGAFCRNKQRSDKPAGPNQNA